MKKKHHIKTSDLRGYAKMATDVTVGMADLVEAMQNRILHPPYLPSTPIQHFISGISSVVYSGIRGIAKLVGGGIDGSLSKMLPESDLGESSQQRETLIAVMNGVVGDYLEQNNNQLMIPMQFRCQGKNLSLDAESIKTVYPQANGKILLMVHGLCMNDLQWTRKDQNHGAKLSEKLGLTPVYLYYNSGRHISSNGQELNKLLDELVGSWPVAVEELHILAHSMGGLVTRSAIHYGNHKENSWIHNLKKVFFLATPHHGAKLEQIGNYVDHLLKAGHFTNPFAQLGKIRSAGITDLRHGSLVDEDWHGLDRFDKIDDVRKDIELLIDADFYAIAAVNSPEGSPMKEKFIGDGLVDLNSALGVHADAAHSLTFDASKQYVVYDCGHLGLLGSPEVYRKLVDWLTG